MPNPLLDSIIQALSADTGPRPSQLAQMVPQAASPIDLGRISVSPQQAQATPIPQQYQPMVSNQPADMGSGVPSSAPQPEAQTDQKAQSDNHSKLGQVLMRIAPTLGAAILGSVNEDALAGSAGFAQGYEGEMSRQQKRQEDENTEDDVVLVDKETGDELKRFRMRRKDKILLGGKEKSLFGGFNVSEDGLIDIPQGKTGDAVKESQSNKVLIEKDGKQFRVPKDQAEQAVKEGYKLLN